MSIPPRLAAALVALAGLFVLAAPLRAQEHPAPQAEALPAAAAKPAAPFLYELRGHGATAYLFGTVHLPDPRVLALPEVVERAFSASDAVYTEIPATKDAELEIGRASVLGGGQTLHELVGEALAERLGARLVAAGLPKLTFDAFKPWAAASALPLLPILRKLASTEPLDKALYSRALKEGKRVGALETVAEQVAVFDGLDTQDQVTMLAEGLDQLERYESQGRDALEELIQAWLSGDLTRLLVLLEEGFGVHEELSRQLEQRLVWDRNARLAQRIDEAVTQKPSEVQFFALGALHLPDGRVKEEASDEERARVRGLLSRLRARGYEVVRLGVREAAPVEAGR